MTGEAEAVATTVGAMAALYGAGRAVRRSWNRSWRRSHRLDHEGRPARVDPSTGRIIEPAQPGIASMISDIHERQAKVVAKVDTLVDNSVAITQIHRLLETQAAENDKRHAENRSANAETRADVADLRATVRDVVHLVGEAAEKAKDAAGHAARIDRQQNELAAQQAGLAASVEAEFEQQRAWTGAYVTALGEMGVHVTPPEQS